MIRSRLAPTSSSLLVNTFQKTPPIQKEELVSISSLPISATISKPSFSRKVMYAVRMAVNWTSYLVDALVVNLSRMINSRKNSLRANIQE